jgi:hypothetical protein
MASGGTGGYQYRNAANKARPAALDAGAAEDTDDTCVRTTHVQETIEDEQQRWRSARE